MEKLDLLLIAPPIFYSDDGNIWKEINSNFPPLGLAAIAGHVRSRGFSVRVIDCNIVAPAVDRFEDFFRANYAGKYREISHIGLSAMTCTIKKAYAIAAIAKKYYPRALVSFGGVHPTFLPDEVIADPNVDIVIVGEGEITTEELVSGRPLAQVNGLVYKDKDGSIKKTAPRERIADLDALAQPAYDLLPVLKYRPAKGSYKRLPAMAMMTSRGCPGRCTFCSKALGLKLVFKSAPVIFREIRYLMDNYGIKEILFYDDTFTVFKKNVHELCDLIISSKTDITWTCFARVDFVDPELLKKMARAGCHQIMYGVENVNAEVLRNIKKQINLPQVENAFRWTKEAGIECRAAFMVGNPGDTPETIKENIRFIKRTEPDLLIVNITTPFPGTEMFAWAKERGLILTYDWDDYTLAKPVMKLENLTPDQIQGLYQLMYKSFYFRPKYIMKKVLSIRSWDDFMVYFDGFKSLLAFFVKKR